MKTQVLKRNCKEKLPYHWLGKIEAELDQGAEKSKMHFVSDCASYFCRGVIY
jgi:hypothetical protein